MNMVKVNKALYVLSDTKRISKFSNIPLIPKRNQDYHVIPVFESKECLDYVKKNTNHSYHVIKVNMDDLEKYAPSNTKIAVITALYCALNDKREYIDYDLFEVGDGPGDKN
jgi:hypothetical protein